MLGLADAQLVDLRPRKDHRGALIPVDHNTLPFTPVRGFYVYGVPEGLDRGGHAHHVTEQAVIALNGAFTIDLTDGDKKVTFRMASREHALYIPPMIWDRLYDFSADAVCFVFASTTYQQSDYVRDWDAFVEARRILRSAPPA
ncbi:MAG TPA: FdtA/QdtA family cupin domain-containing protein [Burkholderiales bacterium]|nr:FdtA/QdtA family cupin domain-containing protein [Burkholderiales bacterium]